MSNQIQVIDKLTPNTLIANNEMMGQLSLLADKMSTAGMMVPAHFQSRPADCLMLCMKAAQLGLDPIAMAQETSEINGKLTYNAKLTSAIVIASGQVHRRPNIEWVGDWDKRGKHSPQARNQKGGFPNEAGLGVRVGYKFKGDEDYTMSHTLYLEDVTIRNSPLWKTDPQQQMIYLATKRWERIYMPDATMGLYSEDDVKTLEAEKTMMAEERDITPPPAETFVMENKNAGLVEDPTTKNQMDIEDAPEPAPEPQKEAKNDTPKTQPEPQPEPQNEGVVLDQEEQEAPAANDSSADIEDAELVDEPHTVVNDVEVETTGDFSPEQEPQPEPQPEPEPEPQPQPEPETLELDTWQMPHDPRMHTDNKATTKDGQWRTKRKPKALTDEQWQAQLSEVIADLKAKGFEPADPKKAAKAAAKAEKTDAPANNAAPAKDAPVAEPAAKKASNKPLEVMPKIITPLTDDAIKFFGDGAAIEILRFEMQPKSKKDATVVNKAVVKHPKKDGEMSFEWDMEAGNSNFDAIEFVTVGKSEPSKEELAQLNEDIKHIIQDKFSFEKEAKARVEDEVTDPDEFERANNIIGKELMKAGAKAIAVKNGNPTRDKVTEARDALDAAKVTINNAIEAAAMIVADEPEPEDEENPFDE